MTTNEKPGFTPGPWKIKNNEHSGEVAVVYCTSQGVSNICGKRARPWGAEIHDANAHLIAAAPDLYGALSGLLKVTDSYLVGEADGPGLVLTRQVAKYALAKARGEA